MKIIFDGLIYYLQEQGGISRYFDELIGGLSKIDDCEVILLMRKNKINKVFNDKVKIEIINSKIRTNRKFLKYIDIFKDRIIVNKFLNNKDFFDAVFHYSYYSFYKSLKIKSVVTVHDFVHEKFPDFFSGLLNKVYLFNKFKSINKADKLIAISQQTKKDLIDIYKVVDDKIDVVYHGINKSFNVLSFDEKKEFLNKKNILKPFLLFVGNRRLYKNFLFFLEVFALWNKDFKFDLFCVGGGDFNKQENDKIKELGLNDSVKLFLNVEENDLISFYNCSKAFVYPSLYEGFGLPILEGLSCGALVLASDIPVFREIGQDSLIYFNPKDKESLIIAMNKILINNTFDQDKVNNLLKKFNWENTILKTLDVYKK